MPEDRFIEGEPIREDWFIQEADKDATPANDERKVPLLEDDGKLSPLFIRRSFGGDGSDGPLIASSGTTTINLGGERFVVKNYSEIALTGTAALAFSNPHPNGTVIIFRVLGDVTLTSSATIGIDLRNIGALGKTTSGSNSAEPGENGTGTVANPLADTTGANPPHTILGGCVSVFAGAGGGKGTETGTSAVAGKGGRGGGGMLIECAGTFTRTCTVDASGGNATDGVKPSAGSGSSLYPQGGDGGGGAEDGQPGSLATETEQNHASGGGGGGGGSFVVVANAFGTNTGSVNVSGGLKGVGASGGVDGGDGGDGYYLFALNTVFV